MCEISAVTSSLGVCEVEGRTEIEIGVMRDGGNNTGESRGNYEEDLGGGGGDGREGPLAN